MSGGTFFDDVHVDSQRRPVKPFICWLFPHPQGDAYVQLFQARQLLDQSVRKPFELVGMEVPELDENL